MKEAHMLAALLANFYGPLQGVDLSDLSEDDRLFLLGSCSAAIILDAVCRMSGNDIDRAAAGVDAIFEDLRRNLTKRSH